MTADVPLTGIVHGLSNSDYHKVAALSATGLKLLSKSPRLCFDMTLNPARPIKEPSPAMKNGTLVHCALLESDELHKRYCVKPSEMDLRTKEGKSWLYNVPPSMEVVTEEAMQAAQQQANAVKALPEIAKLLSNGVAEVSGFWVDDETGVRCKCRPDFVSPVGDEGGSVIMDLKTSVDASPKGFARSIAEYRYHGAAAHYSDGWEQASGTTVHGFVLAVVENSWPYLAAAYMIDDDGMSMARRENDRLKRVYAECMRSNTWPGYAETIQPISLPPWYRGEA